MMPEPATLAWSRRLGAGLLLVSLCLLGLELVLVRIFSVLMWYHFVSLIVSLALFGITVSGLIVFLFPGRFPAHRTRLWLGRASLLLSAAMLAAWSFFWLLARSPLLAYRILAPFHQPFFEPFGARSAGGLLTQTQVLPLATLYLISSLPFILGGFVATLLLTRFADRAARVYAWDLAGAGLGCVVAFILLTRLDPFAVLCVFAALAAGAAFLFYEGAASRAAKGTALTLAVVSVALAAGSVGGARVELKFVRGRYQPDLLLARWNSYSRIAVYPLRGGQGEGSWGMSRSFRGAVPEQLGLVVDDTGYTNIARYRPGDDLSWARANLLSLPYLLRQEPEALIIGPGGGKDILIARANSEGRIRAVEINPLVVGAVQEDFADFSGRPYTLPGVEGIVDEGRTFLRRDSSHYDIIQATVVYGQLSPSAGAFTFTEDHLYTLEAIGDYLNRLKPDGILAVSRFVYEKRILRLVATARAALEARGAASPAGHLFIAAERGLASVLVKAEPFSPGETAVLERRCRELGFDVLYSPVGPGDGPFSGLLRAGRMEEFAATLSYDISPVTDDRPFFYYVLRPLDFFRLASPHRQADFEDQALLLVRNLLAVVLLLVAVFIILPVAVRGRVPGIPWPRAALAVAYFAAIGLGFIVVEIALLKRFLLLLGKPVYTLAATLSVFLLAGGVGSWRARRLAGQRSVVRRKCAALVVVLLLTVVLLPALLELVLSAPLGLRLAVTVAVMAPLGYLMGQPFPLGAALVRERDERLIPWIWSVNGALSVLGSVATLVLAVNFGYTATMLVGPAAYLVAAVLAEEL